MTTDDKPQMDPVIRALIDRLPPPGATFPSDARTAWLDLMSKAFDLVYRYRDPSVRKKRRDRKPSASEPEGAS